MPPPPVLITGATGLLGSHLAEQLSGAGRPVRALVRPGSDVAFLQQLGVELVEGDLRDPEAVRRAVRGAETAYHCAARVTDWGPWSAFVEQTVQTTRNVAEACRAEGVGRLLHVSSISVYGYPKLKPGEQVTEEWPLAKKFWLWDYYARSKVLAEEEARAFPATTTVRPCWVYGPRDRTTVPRIAGRLLKTGRPIPFIGRGDNVLNILYAGDVARGARLAAEHPGAAGQAFNLCSTGEARQKDLLETITDALMFPRPTRRVPYRVARAAGFFQEVVGRMLGRPEPPTITRRAVFLVGRGLAYSSEKARTMLGWTPQVGIREGVWKTLEWFAGVAERRGVPFKLIPREQSAL